MLAFCRPLISYCVLPWMGRVPAGRLYFSAEEDLRVGALESDYLVLSPSSANDLEQIAELFSVPCSFHLINGDDSSCSQECYKD